MHFLLSFTVLIMGSIAYAQESVAPEEDIILQEEVAPQEPQGEWSDNPPAETVVENPLEKEKAREGKTVELRVLDKVTARSSIITGAINEELESGLLSIVARVCWIAPTVERPEQAVLLEIKEMKPDEGPKSIFSGWMFASSPGLSALAHPVYDVTLVSCKE